MLVYQSYPYPNYPHIATALTQGALAYLSGVSGAVCGAD